MNFSSITYFLQLEHERSFSRAAEKLNITQQTLSGHIASMEKELQCPLFIRHIPLELTYGGEVFLQYARRIQCEYANLQQAMQEIREERKGRLRIGIAPTRGHAILPAVISAYQKEWPQVTISIIESVNETLMEMVRMGEVDLAILGPSKVGTEALVTTDFYEEEIVLLVPDGLYERLFSGLPESRSVVLKGPEDFLPFASCPLLLNPQGDISGRFASSLLKQAGIDPVVKVRSHNIETLLEMCAQGDGACFTPLNLAEAVLSPQALSHMVTVRFGERARYMIHFTCLRERSRWKMLQGFIKMAKAVQHSRSRKMKS